MTPPPADPARAETAPAGTVPVPRQRSHRRRLGEVLVGSGLLSAEELARALDIQAEVRPGASRKRLGAVVVEQGMLDEGRLASGLAEALGLERVNLRRHPVDTAVAHLLPRSLCERHCLVAVGRTGTGALRVATADPTNVVALDDVRLYAGSADITVAVATEGEVLEQIARVWAFGDGVDDTLTGHAFDDADAEGLDERDDLDVAAGPVVRLVNDMYADALRLGASDIHVEPQTTGLRIRYRVDGLLRDVTTAPRRIAAAVVSRIKVTSGLDIAEKRRPQDGRTRVTVAGRIADARISTLPTVHGEKVVIRLLPASDDVPPLTGLGLSDRQCETLLAGLLAPQGLILITGPTGSGKTNTLYSAIQQVRTPERNVVTVEDPVEIQLAGVNQVQVHERSGLTFASGLRSILRQDPDVVLVGEVRDIETARLALRASLTGHLVLTTLHTNDAVAALTRLVDMGVEPLLVASSLTMVVAQRLVRRPCPGCAAPYTPSRRTLDLLGLGSGDIADATPVRGRGCGGCGDTGYQGRVGIFEVLPVTAALRRVLLTSPTEADLRAAARSAGMTTLRAAGLAKAERGETTYEEVLRVTHVDATDGTCCKVCEHALDDDMVVCPWCATPIDRGHCGGCGRPLHPEWRLCPWCRTPADDAGMRPLARVRAARRLLVVDDDEGVQCFVRAALDGEIEVDVAGTAEAALAAVADGDYDGVLLDQGLPDLTGLEVLRLLRGDPATATVPVLLFSGQPERELGPVATAAGADGYLAKPLEPDQLAERVRALCDRRGRVTAH